MQIAVFTAWPELIRDQHKKYDLVFKESCQKLVNNSFETNDVTGNIARLVAWVHDRKYHAEFEICLFVVQPVQIEIADIVFYLDNQTTTYFDPDMAFVFYCRRPQWSSKVINVEKSPNPAGMILIDCWQDLVEPTSYTWVNPYTDYDFYKDMKNHLQKYNINRLVFHTGTFGDLPLANQLQAWESLPQSRTIMNTIEFKRHYQQIELYDWIVVGAIWQICTHDKPLGFLNLLDLKKQDPKLRIYSHMSCTIKYQDTTCAPPVLATCVDQDYEMDNLIWRQNGQLQELMLN